MLPCLVLLRALAGLLAFTCLGAQASFDFGQVMQMAGELAARLYKPSAPAGPDELRKLSFGQHQAIRFKPERALWHGTLAPFEVSFVHMGMSFDRAVRLNEVSSDGVRRVPFDPQAFDYAGLKLPSVHESSVGFAGFRVLYSAQRSGRKADVVAFLGASYFRAVAEGLRMGLAARGLAIDTGEASGEEFPRFVEFWLLRPAPAERQLVVLALLDSRRVTGAFRFAIRPVAPTRMEVKARIFLRENVAKLGIAPFTSMYLYGENQPPAAGAARPEVHDSDGLSILAGSGEWLWRPLVNPRRLLITSFAMDDPAGYGLMQRDRTFRSYEDLDARFDLKPSAWVVPKGKWGKGRIELVQIPSPDETNDNIVAYWRPASQPAPGKPLDLEYELQWGTPSELPAPAVHVVQTRRLPSQRRDKPNERVVALVVDFEPVDAHRLPADLEPSLVVSSGDNGEIVERVLRRHEATGGWRATIRVRQIDEKRPLELRGRLNAGTVALSEVWSYIVPPE